MPKADPRKKGLKYFVLAETTDEAGATKLADFCRSCGLESYVLPSDNKKHRRVIACPGFDPSARLNPEVKGLEAQIHSIGEKWAQAKLSVAEEHVAAQAVIDAVARSQPLAERPGEPVRPDRGTAIVAAVAGELHDIAARMAACLLRAHGFEVLAPLAQTPARDLADLILRSRAVLVALSSTINPEVAEQVGMSVAAARQTGGRVLVGGEAMRKARLPEEAKLLRSFRELESESHDAGRKRPRS